MVRDLWGKDLQKGKFWVYCERVKGWWMGKVENRRMDWGKHKDGSRNSIRHEWMRLTRRCKSGESDVNEKPYNKGIAKRTLSGGLTVWHKGIDKWNVIHRPTDSSRTAGVMIGLPVCERWINHTFCLQNSTRYGFPTVNT